MTKVNELIEELQIRSKKEKIYIFGAGLYGKLIGKILNRNKIVWYGYIDNNEKLYDQIIEGKRVFGLNFIENSENIIIIISISPIIHNMTYDKNISNIKNQGINEKKIIRLSENYELMDDLFIYDKNVKETLNRLEEFKNKYENRRCFIIGNGPSLCIQDLELLKKEITLGCNGLIQIIKDTKWRPTCFYFEDVDFIKEYVKDKRELEYILNNCKYAFTSMKSDIFEKFKEEYDNLYFFHVKRNDTIVRISEDIKECIYVHGTSLYGMIQIAIYMGIKEIYLLGVDFSFRKEIDADGKMVENKNVKNHMLGMDEIEEGTYRVDLIMESWLKLKEYAESHKIKIYNVTRGGKLEVFERIKFEDLFDE